ncbi:GlsB/YeaQ/YmgE family stress response membrane protein [Streptomyces avidinii]|uniref:GlsB/YeaQ/YmgE family stress response membrane protein n=1 Tax=Streptomyces avidinii TaxID=1895 RepID=UPI0037A7A411
MGVISWITLGLLAGGLARLLLPGRDPGGVIGATVIGVAGALLGGWLSEWILGEPIERHLFDLTTWGAAIGGSLVLLTSARLFFGDGRD